MENKNDFQDERFDSFLNKTIIYSSKKYFKKQMDIVNNESMIMDNENYPELSMNFANLNKICDTIDNIDISMQLDDASRSLSAIEQAVIFLLFKKELSQDDAAKILDICSKSVSRIKLRAIEKLKKYFEEDF